MTTETAELAEKTTLVPLLDVASDVKSCLPFDVSHPRRLRVVQTTGLLRESDFSLWRENVSEKERRWLSSSSVGLTHEFLSTGHIGREEAESKDLVSKVALCLLIIKPTRSPFISIQYRRTTNDRPDVFSFTHPPDTGRPLPLSEVLNQLTVGDLRLLRDLLEPFLAMTKQGPRHLQRAVQLYRDACERIESPAIQMAAWVAGIESLYRRDMEEYDPFRLVSEIKNRLGENTNIYEATRVHSLGGRAVTVGSCAEHVFELRNRFMHGLWIPDAWNVADHPSGSGEKLTYADTLREAACFILRKSIVAFLTEGEPEP